MTHTRPKKVEYEVDEIDDFIFLSSKKAETANATISTQTPLQRHHLHRQAKFDANSKRVAAELQYGNRRKI